MNNNTNHSIYSRLLNQEIDSNKLHKFGVNGSYFLPVGSTGVQAKSLNSRVAELTGVNTPSIIPLGSLVPNGSSKHQSIINNKNTHTHSSGTNNKFKLKKYLQTIYGFDASNVDLILSKDLVYQFNNSYNKYGALDSILDNSFYTKQSLTGTKVYEVTNSNVTLQLFLYSSEINSLKNDYLKYLCAYISKKIKKPFKLNLIRLRNLKSDSVISAKAIGIIANKIKNTVRPVAHRFLRNSRVIKPRMLRSAIWARYVMEGQKRGFLKLAYFTGAHIKLGGRLKRQRLTNRITTMTFQKGSLNRVSSDLLTTARYTSKSVRGAFSITVTMAHKFF